MARLARSPKLRFGVWSGPIMSAMVAQALNARCARSNRSRCVNFRPTLICLVVKLPIRMCSMLKIPIRLARWLKISNYTTSGRVGWNVWSATGYRVQNCSPLGWLLKDESFTWSLTCGGVT
ncbi:hypothetical protein IG631_02008 [Alternaria alternata]|nr:hypothetical protein IG631_02008 [Alternaria alternata]